MKLDFCVICDYCSAGPDGKMAIVGTFDRVFCAKPPAQLPMLGIALRFRGEKTDATGGKMHKIQLRVRAPDNNTLAQLDAEVGAPPGVPADKMEENTIVLPFLAQNLVFPQYGKYSFEVWMDNRLLSTSSLYVCAIPAQANVSPVRGGTA